jgi:hypothetical protein
MRNAAPVAGARRTAARIAALLCGLIAGAMQPALAGEDDVEARYAGCESAGWCRLWIDPPYAASPMLYRMRPKGLPYAFGGPATARSVRDRLNALLASMIHQNKRIEVRGIRPLDDGTHTATILVNGADVSSDPLLSELLRTAPVER